jgi:hypothetical protein
MKGPTDICIDQPGAQEGEFLFSVNSLNLRGVRKSSRFRGLVSSSELVTTLMYS